MEDVSTDYPLQLIFMSDIVWYGLFPLFGQLLRFSFVNTDWNCSFNISALLEVPQDWRDANIVPLFKKDERHLASNYRPLSLTSITCKILEHIVHSNIMDHFDKKQERFDTGVRR
jgi:hypothetical protein